MIRMIRVKILMIQWLSKRVMKKALGKGEGMRALDEACQAHI
jgi:hypothetical protein